MNQQSSPPPDYQRKPSQAISKAERSVNEFNASVAALRTEADRARGLFGIGRRIIVPPDEIHVVVGDGKHSFLISSERKIFGQTADRPSRYWLNGLTQVIKLKTISFTVPLRGVSDEGIEALDRSKVSFRLWAHAVAKLNPDKAEIAAQRVGLDTTGLVSTITQVGTAELIAAAATMDLENTIAERQRLAAIAFPKVNQILSELGYDLALLTITRLEGIAYQKLVEQAESRISKETSIATNLEQVAELQDNQSRARTEAEIQADTEKKLANERLEAQREVETATLGQQEALAVRRHEVEVKRIERDKLEAEVSHQTDLAKVQLNQKLGEAEAEKEARLARVKTERDAELRALQQERQAAIRMIETKADAERMALEQMRKIERAAEQTLAEAKRLREEELAAAERTKDIALVEAGQLAEALKVEAEAQARALQLKVDAETKAELTRAEAEASATEKRAKAAKVRADATRAESAASGLAEAEVDAARVQVSEKRVAVTRSEGLALAEVARAQAEAEAERLLRLKDVEINAQQRQVELYSQAPVLVDLEKMRMQFEHEERIASLRMETSLKAIQAIAPGVKVRVFGSGGQSGQFINEIISFTQGLNIIGEDAPVVNKMLQGSAASTGNGGFGLAKFLPYIQQIMAETNPRVFSSLKLSDLVDRLGPVVAGQQDLADALSKLRNDANFRVVGDVPIGPLMNFFGIKLQKGEANDPEGVIDKDSNEIEDVTKKHPDMPA
jgi:hypothetical protein